MQAELFILSLVIYEVFLQCSPKNVNFIGFEKTHKVGDDFVIRVNASKCPGLDYLYYKWEVREMQGAVVQTATTPFIIIHNYSFNRDLKKQYQLTVILSHYKDMSASSSFSDTFWFSTDNSSVEIGNESFTGVRTLPLVDTRSSRLIRATAKLGSIFEVICILNCENPHPKAKTAIYAICLFNCKGATFVWDIEPPIPDEYTDFMKNLLIIKPNAFQEGESAIISAESDMDTSQITLEFENKIVPGTCDITPKSGVSGLTVFKVNCTGFSTPKGTLHYLVYQKCEKSNSYVMLSVSESPQNNVLLSQGSPAKIIVKVMDDSFFEHQTNLTVEVERGTLKLPDLKAKRNKVVQIVSSVLDVLDEKGATNKRKMVVQKYLAERLLKSAPNNFFSAWQITTILVKLQAFMLSTDTTTSSLMGESILRVANIIRKFVCKSDVIESPVPQAILRELVGDVCSLSFKLIKEVPELLEILKPGFSDEDYKNIEVYSPKFKIQYQMRQLLDHIFMSVEMLGNNYLRESFPDEKPTFITNDFMKLVTRKIRFVTLEAQQIITHPHQNDSWIFVPRTSSQMLSVISDVIDYQLALMNKNPFWWMRKFNTELLLFDFFTHCHKIPNMKSPILVHLKTNNIPVGVLKGNTTKASISVHRIHVSKTGRLIIRFKPSPESFEVAVSKHYCVEKDFAKGIEIRNDSKESERTLEVVRIDNNRVVYVCVRKLEANLQYEAIFSQFACSYWNLEIGHWSCDDCTLQKALLKNNSFMECECKHASFYAGTIDVPQYRLNFNLNFNITIRRKKNYIPLVLLVIVVPFWAVVLLVAILQDRKFSNRGVVCLLEDNVPGDSHAYLVVVFTGYSIHAGTTADVAFQIFGENANSRVHVIKCRRTPTLRWNSEDWLIIYTPCFLGDLKKIRIWHNCKGAMPHWFCQRIIVEHLDTRTQYCFLTEKWFSLIWGNGKVYHEIPLTKNRFFYSKKLLFKLTFETQIKSRHILFSLLTRSPQHRYTNAERASVLMSTFFISFLVSALSEGIPTNTAADSIDPPLSNLLVTFPVAHWLSSICSQLIALFVKFIFKNSSPDFKLPFKRTKHVHFKKQEVICFD